MAEPDLAAQRAAPGSSRASIVLRNRKAAAVRQQLAQKRLEAKMAGAEYGSAPVKAPSLSDILARVRAAALRHGLSTSSIPAQDQPEDLAR